MYRYKILFGFIVFFFVVVSSPFAQNEVNKEDLRDLTNLNDGVNVLVTKAHTENIGSPYLNEDFLKGHIILNEYTNSQPLFIRYNIHENEVEFLREDEVYISDPNKLIGFKFYTNDGDITFKNGFSSTKYNISNKRFLRQIYKSEVSLLAKHTNTLNKDIPSYGSATKTNRYQTFLDYYIRDSDGTFKKINLNDKTIENLSKQTEKKINNYIKNNSLDLSNEDDLINLTKFYEKLSQ